ncbi:MAG: CBS domain-containing protein [Holophagaceae bacterium]|nr:CBS domain-containing protein [Holophagaceae bacterium]
MTTVGEWMTRNPVTIEADASLIEAIHLLKEKGIRRLPVMRDGRFTGLITDRMLSEYSPSKATSLDTWEVHYLLSKTPVSEVMNPAPITVGPEVNLVDAARIFLEHRLYGLCVVNDEGQLVGIMSVGDILKAVVEIFPKA